MIQGSFGAEFWSLVAWRSRCKLASMRELASIIKRDVTQLTLLA